MERLSKLDPDGNEIGYESYARVHKEGIMHRTVHLLIFSSSGDVMLQKRKDGKLSTSCGGHVRYKEQSKDAMAREMLEETGLRLEFQFVAYLDNNTRETNKEIIDLYKAKITEFKQNNRMGNDYLFIPIKKLEEDIISNPEKYTQTLKNCIKLIRK